MARRRAPRRRGKAAVTHRRAVRAARPVRLVESAGSVRAQRVAELTRLAATTFGGRAAAGRWLETPNRALRDATPLSLLGTEPGARQVRRILSSIAHGGVF